MRRVCVTMLVSFLLIFMTACTPESPPLNPNDLTPTVAVTFSPTPTTEPSISATPTPTEEVTPVVTEEPTPTVTEEPTPTPTEDPTPSVTEEPTPTVTATPTSEPTATPIPTNTPVPTNTPTPTQQPATPVPTKEPTKAPTNTPVPTKAPTSTPKPTNTPKPTQKPTNTPTPVPTKAPEQPTTMWVQWKEIEVLKPDASLDTIGHLSQGDKVVVTNTNVLNRLSNYIAEIQYGNGIAYIQLDGLSASPVEPKWSEPRERKDMETLLMNKVNAYRESNGIRKFEDPYVYDDTSDPGMGPYLYEKGVRVAKKCCMEHTANHEGSQIGAGWYSTGQGSPRSAEEVANELFNNWKNSPGHNGCMLTNSLSSNYIDVAVMVVVEYYDGSNYQYCAIMTYSGVGKSKLPEGLQ